jgi:hypothetical protein
MLSILKDLTSCKLHVSKSPNLCVVLWLQIWVGASIILLCVLWVVYFVASQPKNVLEDDEGRRAVREAVAKLLESTGKAAGSEADS